MLFPSVLTALALSSQSPVDRVLVLDLEASEGISADTLRVLTHSIAETVARDTSIVVITSTDLKTLSSVAADKIACGIDDGSCIAELAGAMDVRRVLSGRVSKIGDEHVAQLALFDTKQGASSTRVSWRAPTIEKIVSRAPNMTNKLLGRALDDTKSAGISPVWGGVTLGAGAVVGGLATAAGIALNGTVTDTNGDGNDKDFALDFGRWGVVGGAGLALALATTGAVLLVVSE